LQGKLDQLFDLTGRVALVTGGAGLLGMEFCRTLAQAGAQVVSVDLAEPNNGLDASVGSVMLANADITDPAAVEKVVTTTVATFGRLDVLVNSAALDPKFDPQHIDEGKGSANLASGAFETFPLDAWKKAVDVNLTGAFLCCQAAVKPMLAQGSGVIINIASMYGLVGPDQRLYQRPGQPAKFKPVYYTVTKAGILGLTHYLAAYYAGKNIRVNALTPGGVFNGHDADFLQAYAARSILGRMANKDEMNGALLFLASDASSYMTGANLVVDGGWTAW
jgi:NAD(P)-dependent dehydrogenase (short-subunit alcohol dehydrogenase family)